MTSQHPIRIAIVGCGSVAPTHADALVSLAPETAILSACCDIVRDRAQVLGKQHGVPERTLSELLADREIDALSVCTPSGLHAEIGSAGLRAGKHVIVEKPMDVSLEACDRLLAAQRESGKTLAVISQHRWDPASIRVRDALRQGELGTIVMVDARIPWYRGQEYYDSGDWRGTWALDGGGCLMNQGIHTVDLMRWLCGPSDTVYAAARTAAHTGIEVEDAIAATLTFRSGAIGTLMASTAAYPGFPARLTVHGTLGTAIIEGDALQFFQAAGRPATDREMPAPHALQVATGGTRAATSAKISHHSAHEEGWGGAVSASVPAEWGWAHREQLRDFAECCRKGAVPAVDGIAGRQAVALVVAAYESSRTGLPAVPAGDPL